MTAFASSLDQVGPLAKTVRDAALIMNAIAGPDSQDSTSLRNPVPDYTAGLNGNLRGVRLGVPKEYLIGGIDPEVKRAVNAAIEHLQSLGVEIVFVSLPHTEYAVSTYYIISTAEASANLARFDGVRYGYRAKNPKDLFDHYARTRGEGFGAEVKRRIILGTYVLSSGYYDAYYLRAQQVRALIRQDFTKALEKVDALISPTTPELAFELGERLGYLRPGRLPTGLVQAGEHLVQRAERLPLEPDTVGRRGQPQRRGHKPGDHVAEPGRRECLFEHTGAAEAERAWLAGGKRRELRAPAND